MKEVNKTYQKLFVLPNENILVYIIRLEVKLLLIQNLQICVDMTSVIALHLLENKLFL